MSDEEKSGVTVAIEDVEEILNTHSEQLAKRLTFSKYIMMYACGLVSLPLAALLYRATTQPYLSMFLAPLLFVFISYVSDETCSFLFDYFKEKEEKKNDNTTNGN